MSEKVVEQIQANHYGYARMESRTLHELITMVTQRSSDGEGCELPVMGQLHLWQNDIHANFRVP